MNNQEGKKLVVVSGPSGVGKSTICKAVAQRMDHVCLSVSMTTRPKAESEIDGQDYWYISEEEFKKRVDRGLFLEHAKVFGHYYGTPKDKVDEALGQGKVVILEIDVQGGRQVKTLYPDAVMVFIVPPSQKELAQRLNGRARENSEQAEERLEWADDEMAAGWQYYNHMVINADLEQAINEVIQILKDNT